MSSNMEVINHLLAELRKAFRVTVMEPKNFVGIEIYRNRKERTVTISQTNNCKIQDE